MACRNPSRQIGNGKTSTLIGILDFHCQPCLSVSQLIGLVLVIGGGCACYVAQFSLNLIIITNNKS